MDDFVQEDMIDFEESAAHGGSAPALVPLPRLSLCTSERLGDHDAGINQDDEGEVHPDVDEPSDGDSDVNRGITLRRRKVAKTKSKTKRHVTKLVDLLDFVPSDTPIPFQEPGNPPKIPKLPPSIPPPVDSATPNAIAIAGGRASYDKNRKKICSQARKFRDDVNKSIGAIVSHAVLIQEELTELSRRRSSLPVSGLSRGMRCR